jgi:phosphatidate phosphatase
MLLVEILHWRRNDNKSADKSISCFGKTIPQWVVNSYKAIGTFGFGAASSQLLTDIAKYSIGRLRPHFIYVCKPDIDCNSDAFRNKYVEDFICEGSNTRLLREAR